MGIALLIRLPWTPENTTILSFAGTVVFECALIDVTSLGCLSKLYVKSISTFDDLEKILHSSRRKNKVEFKWKQRFYKSCGAFKARFDPLNYLDEETPLICMDLVANLTVNVLLLT